MSKIDTSADVVELLARDIKQLRDIHPLREVIAAPLRALMAERDAAQADAARLRETLIAVLHTAANPVGGWLDGERGAAIGSISKIALAALIQEEPCDE